MRLVDTLSDLQYASGFVSLKLKASASASPSVELAIPFAAFAEVVASIKGREGEFTKAHSTWLANEVAGLAVTDQTMLEAEPAPAPRLGKRLASI